MSKVKRSRKILENCFATSRVHGSSCFRDFLTGKQALPSTHKSARRTISYELIDALGHTRMQDMTEKHSVLLDATSLPQGVYFLRASSEDGFAVTRKVMIEH